MGDRAALARDADTEGRSVWIRAVRSSEDGAAEPRYRWCYPALGELLARPPEYRPDWHQYLADADPVVAANAAIALARSGDGRAAEQLARTVRSPQRNGPMRAAAVESLAGLEGPAVVPLLRELLDQYGSAASEPGSTYLADLHAELIRGLARHVEAAGDPRFTAALRSPAADVRIEALRAWTDTQRVAGADGHRREASVGEPPDRRMPGGSPTLDPGHSASDAVDSELLNLCADTDRGVRAAALRAVAARRHSQAGQCLGAALKDQELTVRIAAIAGLGELGGAASQAALEGLLDGESEAIRAAAVCALARLGAKQTVLGAAADRSWRVRQEVAKALAGYADGRGAVTARRLLEDPSAAVQQEVVTALAQWPLAQAAPLLLEAADSRSLTTRQSAARALAARWPPAGDLPVAGEAARRSSVIEELQRQLRQEFGPDARAAATESTACGPPPGTVSPLRLDQVEQLVRQQNVEELLRLGPGVVEALEELAVDRQQTLPEIVYREVLSQCDPAFAALDRLACADVSPRREAAGQLAELARTRPLRPLVMARLARVAVAERDPLVWQRLLTAVADDGSEPSMRLAYAAIGHPSAEVRRRACEHLAAHPSAAHAEVLLPALEDDTEAVVCAAVRAIGAAGRPADAEPLRWLLRTTSQPLRLETAVALHRLGDPGGAAELERLAYSSDAGIRRAAAEAIGGTGDPTLVPTLIRLLDDRPAVQRAALEALPKTSGHEVSGPDDRLPPGTAERVRRWKQWFARREVLAAREARGQPTDRAEAIKGSLDRMEAVTTDRMNAVTTNGL